MMNPVNLSVIVPCYNEEKNIPRVVEGFASALAHEKGIELILVDNGSRDKTGERIDHEIRSQGCGFARKVTVPENQGYGFGILSGLKEAQGGVLAWTHADLQTDLEDVLRAYRLYLEHAEKDPRLLVKGYRKNRRFTEKFFSLGMQVTASLALGTWLSEINAQPKLFPRSFYEQMEDAPHDFSLDLYVLYLAKKKGYRLLEMPVFFKPRLFGEAKGGGGASWETRLKLMRRSFLYIFELRSKMMAKQNHKPCS